MQSELETMSTRCPNAGDATKRNASASVNAFIRTSARTWEDEVNSVWEPARPHILAVFLEADARCDCTDVVEFAIETRAKEGLIV